MKSESIKQATEEFREYLYGMSPENLNHSRERIIVAFLRLAVEHGLQSVSMRMLGDAVGIKAPSVYSHFPGGRDEIVSESLRWNLRRFGSALLEQIDSTKDDEDYWNTLVRVHLMRQISLPESNLWDLIIASDRVTEFLPPSLRAEVYEYLSLHENMYFAGALALGTDSEEKVRIVITVLEGASRWLNWDGTQEELDRAANRAIPITHALLGII